MASRRTRQPKPCEPTLKIIATFLSDSDSRWWFIVLNLPMLIVCPIAELDAAETEESSEPLPKEWYVSGFLMRSYPIGGTLKFDGDKIPDTSFDRAIGGGLKIGVFPSAKSIFGAEVEASGHGGSITAPQTVLGNTVRSAQLDMTLFNFMVNALARYPGDIIQPYVGAGLGLSILGMDGHTQSSAGIRESDSLLGLTLQASLEYDCLLPTISSGSPNINLRCFLGKKVTGVLSVAGTAATKKQIVRRIRPIALTFNPIAWQ
jgi:hypothetical protein